MRISISEGWHLVFIRLGFLLSGGADGARDACVFCSPAFLPAF